MRTAALEGEGNGRRRRCHGRLQDQGMARSEWYTRVVRQTEPLRSENRETTAVASAIMRRMDLDDDACYRAIATRDPRFDGRLFVAVKTTGIYCRPFCPAPHAEARERALLPDRRRGAGGRLSPLPALPAGNVARSRRSGAAAPTPFPRALGLIEAGALDEANVETPWRNGSASASVSSAGCSSSILAPRRSPSRRRGGSCSPSS